MEREVFGTDGIRGPAGKYPLNAVGACQVGKAVATYFAKPGESILIGRDPRESSLMLEEAVSSGIAAMGVKVKSLGVLPTPGLAYLTKKTGVQAGVMITASHNPYTDNGIKVFSPGGTKLPDNVEVELNKLIRSDLAINSDQAKVLKVEPLVNDYENFLVSSADNVRFEGFKLAIDCANGATSLIAKRIFERLGAQVVPLFDHPDGKNINANCGATNTKALQSTVKKLGLDAGIAFDGDGDRVILIDSKGRQLTGDHILYILALNRKERGVVATIMSNMGLELALKHQGIELIRTAVGDRYVLEGLEKTGLKLGGEQAGHIILTDYSATGDGLLAAIQTLKQVKSTNKDLAEWFDELVLWPQTLINIKVTDKSLLEHQSIKDFIASQTSQLGESGRLNIRPSGTEPLVRVMLEAPDAAQKAQVIADKLSDLIEAERI
jgi:phosphoglucosamine mutase